MDAPPSTRIQSGPGGAQPHFSRQRPDHSPPELLSDDELARSIDSLERKLRSARRMLTMASVTRALLIVALATVGIAMMALGPAPIVDYFQRRRTLVTTWDVFAWWFAGIVLTSFAGAVALQSVRRRRRRAEGWRHRVGELERRLAEASGELKARTRR